MDPESGSTTRRDFLVGKRYGPTPLLTADGSVLPARERFIRESHERRAASENASEQTRRSALQAIFGAFIAALPVYSLLSRTFSQSENTQTPPNTSSTTSGKLDDRTLLRMIQKEPFIASHLRELSGDALLYLVGGAGMQATAKAMGIQAGNANLMNQKLTGRDPADDSPERKLLEQLEKNPHFALEIFRKFVADAPLLEEALCRLVPSLMVDMAGGKGKQWGVGIPATLAFALFHNVTPAGSGHNNLPIGFNKELNLAVVPAAQFVMGLFAWHLMRERGYAHAVVFHSLCNLPSGVWLALGAKGAQMRIQQLEEQELSDRVLLESKEPTPGTEPGKGQ